MNKIKSVLKDQQTYYDSRAAEYDDWWFRTGEFDEGPEANSQWYAEAGLVQMALHQASLTGDILELAAGTGIWSTILLRKANSLTLVDGSRQMLAQNPLANHPLVKTIHADIFAWSDNRQYDSVVFAFWISHVPREMLQGFLRTVARHLRHGGKFFFVDNRNEPEQRAPHVVESSGQLMKRRLADGRTSTIVKNYYLSEELKEACLGVDLEVDVFETPKLFQFGIGYRR
jgi:demethylmenaquinone methyltransferase/2-methoxy-6-polyprenyl-1,4-benzoquinol methylase